MITPDKSLANRKDVLLEYFRERAKESLEEIKHTYSQSEYKARAAVVNKACVETRDNIINIVLQRAKNEEWSNEEILRCVLTTTYASYVVMIESRNDVWPYEYMTFSRRVGELWEPFCKICFYYPIKELQLFIPPLFSEVKKKFASDIQDYIDSLPLTGDQKRDLKSYYAKVWKLVDSGEIKLEMDLHFEQDGEKFVVDFKSGFGSNEKGNTNRLLLVAAIYRNLEENYRCLLLVRAEEDRNNNYFRILRDSGVWEACCGRETYEKIREHSGFDIKGWVEMQIDWSSDLRRDTLQHFADNDLEQYLKW